jgi:SAM-dependent methyltransferase
MISPTGFWNIDGATFDKEHIYDPLLSQALIVLAKSKNVRKTYDFGCGHGTYTADFIEAGISCKGFDGNPITASIPNCRVQDLTDPHWQEAPVDFLLCLEVCEHVPKEHEEALINTLTRHVNPGGTIVLSWAVPGQGGLGHVNCQTNKYVIELFEKLEFLYNKEESEFLRKTSKEPWFKNTICIFTAKY